MDIDRILRAYKYGNGYINETYFDEKLVGSECYGETGYESIENIVNHFIEDFNNETIFYDLGCGVGKIVFHIGLKYKPKKACGIEYSEKRYMFSQFIMKELKITESNIVLINDNILNCDISDATVIYVDNTAFPSIIDNKIYDIIPLNCLVISRKPFKRYNKLNKIDSGTNYGTNSLYSFIKK